MNPPCLNEMFKESEDKLSFNVDGFNDLNEDDVYPTVLYRLRIPIIAIQHVRDVFTTEKDMYDWVHLSTSFDHVIVDHDDDDDDSGKDGGKSEHDGKGDDIVAIRSSNHYISLIEERSVSVLVDTIIRLLEGASDNSSVDNDDHE